ncbi:MAG: sigma-54-dependent transcriptional regulator [Candidatus Hydrogenedentota bacterium]
MQTILAIDDEPSVRDVYHAALSRRFHVIAAGGGQEGFEALKNEHVDIIILDHMMPEMTGLQFLERLRKEGYATPVIVVTALNSVPVAVDAIKAGARDYLIKPFDVGELIILIERVLDEERTRQELTFLREQEARGFDSIIGASGALYEAIGLARQAAEIDCTVLVTGESGTGKDVLARAIHSAGPRADEPFVHVSCCTMPNQLVESELFGHEKGAFTGANERRHGKVQVADGGTLFLDEIGEMPLESQAKLLHLLQDGCFSPLGSAKPIDVDVRFICATNRNLRNAIAEGLFREDLYYRINVLPVEMPPLRNRREDIPALVNHFIAKYANRVNAAAKEFSPAALRELNRYDWPGNVRELENTVQRILILNRRVETIEPWHLKNMFPEASQPVNEQGAVPETLEDLPLEQATARLEERLIRHALEQNGYVQSKAAEQLGTTRRVLKYKMDQLNIPPEPPEISGASRSK